MQYAIRDGARVRAEPATNALCPVCHGAVMSKCGVINVWHWAHKSRSDCDSWSEGESAWHLNWKERFPTQWREVVVGRHRADVKSPRTVIELQASSISPAEIEEREEFYGDMVWVIDAEKFDLDLRKNETHVSFRWKHPRKTWWYAEKQLYFDLGDKLLRIYKLYSGVPCGGWGKFVAYEEFVSQHSKPKPGQHLCEPCMRLVPIEQLIKTGMTDYYQLDVDPDTYFCTDCYPQLQEARTPDDSSLFDVYTPFACG